MIDRKCRVADLCQGSLCSCSALSFECTLMKWSYCLRPLSHQTLWCSISIHPCFDTAVKTALCSPFRLLLFCILYLSSFSAPIFSRLQWCFFARVLKKFQHSHFNLYRSRWKLFSIYLILRVLLCFVLFYTSCFQCELFQSFFIKFSPTISAIIVWDNERSRLAIQDQISELSFSFASQTVSWHWSLFTFSFSRASIIQTQQNEKFIFHQQQWADSRRGGEILI